MGLSRQSALVPLSVAVLASAAAGFAVAGPNGGTVVGGSATIQGQGSGSVTINQSSQSTIINWATFNIGRGETTTFNQPNSTSTALNRVIGGQGPSILDGTLTANGRVFIVNGDGILFGAHSSINTAGFLATTNDIRNEDFMAGKYNFNIPGLPNASIVNLGSITATSGGFAALVAPGVRNSGTITATLGTVGLAAGNAFTLDFYGDRLITLAVNDQIAASVIDVATGQPLKSLVSNDGKLKANGGRIELTATAARAVVDSVINNTGVIEANAIGTHDGMIVLSAATAASKGAGAPTQTVALSGKISAAGKKAGTSGGTVVVTGENIVLAGAQIDASGYAGGGKVLIGGDTGGGHPSAAAANIELAKLESFVIPTATTVSVDAGTVINASATGTGNGGKVVLWSDQQTTFAGTILAQGGAAVGNGGFVETSSHQQLDFRGTVDLRAPLGSVGTLLLDPADFYIVTTLGGSPTGASEMTNTALQNQLALGNVTITTSTTTNPSGQNGDIFVYSDIGWSSNSTLTLSAYRNINIEPGITISNASIADGPLPSGNLVLRADNTGSGTGTVKFVPSYNFDSGPNYGTIDFSGSNGTVSIFYNPSPRICECEGGSLAKYQNSTNFSSYVFRNDNIGSNQLTAYMLVNNLSDLQNISTNLAGTYALGKNIDASATASTGFVPIGTTARPFTGLLDGQGGAIDQLTINSKRQLTGLFGENDGTIKNVGLTNINITSAWSGSDGGGYAHIGGLAGINQGSIINSFATGTISSNSSYDTAPDTGGLVGANFGLVSRSYASVNVTEASSGGVLYLGGLVGWNSGGTIEQSYAAGSVTSSANSSGAAIGGLVGFNSATIRESYATGAVGGGSAASGVGGLVGVNDSNGRVDQAYARGAVSGPSGAVGGLVGSDNSEGGIIASYWDTQTSGQMTSAGGTGLTTAALQAALPTGWDPTVWNIVSGASYPYLLWQFPNGTQVVSGYVYSDGGVTLVGGGTIVSGLVNGTSLASETAGGAVTTGANGYYNFLVAPGTISSSGSQILTYTTGPNAGVAFQQNATGSVYNLNIYGGYLNETSGAGTLSSVSSGLSTAVGSNATIQAMVNGLANRAINATAASFNVDQAINSGTLLLTSSGAVTQSAPIAATNLALLGSGGTYTLTDSGNQVGTLAADTGGVSLSNSTNLGIGTVANTGGVTASGILTLNVNGTIAAPGAVDVGAFTLGGGNWAQVSSSLPSFAAQDFRIAGGSFLRASGGDGSTGSPYQITDVYGLLGIGSSSTLLANNYVLAGNIDAPGTTSWNGGAGFVPIGSISFGGFTGTFDGQNHTIDGLVIAPTAANVNNIGLFGTNYGSISNLSLINVSITANPNVGLPGQFVGTLAGQNGGTISNVSVTGAVNGLHNGTSLAGVIAGGLVGQNGVVNGNTVGNTDAVGPGNPTAVAGQITRSLANVNVTVGDGCAGADCNGGQSSAGGLVGFNNPTSTIADSQAFGAVIAGAFAPAGGLVGQNFGTITSTTTPTLSLSPLSSCTQGAAYSCATGTVNVGSQGQAGGLAGFNDGSIGYAFATGAITGAAGRAPDNNNSNSNSNQTQLGGLVGVNTGGIALSFATGSVGSANVAYLEVGGLVAENHGAIGSSAASGDVNAGDNSMAGGLTASNSPSTNSNSNCIGGCLVGVAHDNTAAVLSSFALGNITVGAASFAGGLSGTGDGVFSGTSASGNVTGGGNSVLGGLVGGIGVGQGLNSISLSFASGAVSSKGSNSVVGGLVGASGGQIIGSGASGPVSGTSQSYLGGLVGINVGLIQDSSANGLVTGSGAGNFTGGLVGLNFGLVDPSSSTGNVTSGPTSIVGGLIGANGAFGPFNNIPNGVVVPGSFPVGTVSADSLATGLASGGPGSMVGPQFGENYPTSGLPAYPSVVSTCNNGLCAILTIGVLTNPNPPNGNPPGNSPNNPPVNPPPAPSPPTQAQLIQNLVQDITLASVTLGEVVNTQPLNQPPPGPPHTGSGPPPGPGGLPPQFGARFFTPPPPGETHFVQNEVVLQIPTNIPLAQLQTIMARLGLSILGSQNMGLLGVTSYRVHIDNGTSIAAVIKALANYQIVAGAQANYTYGLVQEQAQDPDLAGLTQGEGDAAQYAIGKLGLIDIHRLLKGSNITVAVIDSQIDVKHPDLDGVVAEQFDAVGAADQPHSHGTGMAGAIFAHRRLMGVAPAARLYAIHAFSSGAASAESTTFNILKGLQWASSKGVRVINMSFAGPRDPSLERVLKAAHDSGIVLIAAAGNAGPKSPPLYPGADPNVIAVTATDVNDKLFTGANRGSYIAVAAPGVDVLVPGPDNTYQLTTGTSVASAEVSGLAALLLERNPNLTPDEVRKILTSSARRLGAKDRDDDFGSGLIDPSKAIQTAGDLKSIDITGAVPPRPAPAQKPQPTRAPVLNVNQPNGTGPRPIR